MHQCRKFSQFIFFCLLSSLNAATVLLVFAAFGQGVACAQDAVKPAWSPSAAAKYLDERANRWVGWSSASRGQGTACISCHTTLPYALARPALGEALGETDPGPAEKKVIDNVKARVDGWDQIAGGSKAGKDPLVPFYQEKRRPSALGTEAVLNSLVLVNYDARRNKGQWSEQTKSALEHLWQQQQDSGAWLWLEFGLKPWENDSAYYGASLAAIAVGMAGKEYQTQPAIEPKVAALKKYLQTRPNSQPLHHRVIGLWASSWLPYFQDEEKAKIIEELFALQETDGGWSLAKLGANPSKAGKSNWTGHGTYPEAALSDGYATGLVVLALKRAGVPTDAPPLKNAIAWLTSRQHEGTWPALYPNRPRDPQSEVGQFLREASGGFATLALMEVK
jgi:squalene-hopene/tetraprenyl-beta-curcumene cyclase